MSSSRVAVIFSGPAQHEVAPPARVAHQAVSAVPSQVHTLIWLPDRDVSVIASTRPAISCHGTLRFTSLTGLRPMIERYPPDKAAEAYDQRISARARFRVVLIMGAW